MTQFSHGPITQIPADRETVFAFVIAGHITDDDSEALAKYMNRAFDAHDKVDMLLDLSGMTGSDWDAAFDDDVIRSRFRALKHVRRYAVVGAPKGAATMIGIMDKIIPVDARTFDTQAEAWDFLEARPVAG